MTWLRIAHWPGLVTLKIMDCKFTSSGDCAVRLYGSCKLPCGECTGESSIVHGAAGLAKAALGLDQATPEQIEQRQATCKGCEFSGGVINRCSKCGCVIAAKVRLKGEHCPVGKW